MTSHNVSAVVKPLLNLNAGSIKAHIQTTRQSKYPQQHPVVVEIFEQTYLLVTAILKSQISEKKAQQGNQTNPTALSESTLEMELSAEDQLPYFISTFQNETPYLNIHQISKMIENLNFIIEARFDFADITKGNAIGVAMDAKTTEEQAATFKEQNAVGVRDMAIANLQMALLDTLAIKQALEKEQKQKLGYEAFCIQHMKRFEQEIIKHLYNELKFEMLTLGNCKDMPVKFSPDYNYSELMDRLTHQYQARAQTGPDLKQTALGASSSSHSLLNKAVNLIKKSEPLSIALEKHSALQALHNTLIVPGISAKQSLRAYKKLRSDQLIVFSRRRDSVGMKVFMWLAKQISVILPASFFKTKIQNEVQAQEKKEALRPGV